VFIQGQATQCQMTRTSLPSSLTRSWNISSWR